MAEVRRFFDRFRRNIVLQVDLDPDWLAGIMEDPAAFEAWVHNSQVILLTAVESYEAFRAGNCDHTKVTAAYCAVGHVGRQMASIDAAYAAAQQ